MEKIHRILIVDDDKDQRLLFINLLKGCDVIIDEVGDPLVAIEMIDQNSYDIAIVDLMFKFSIADGVDIVKFIRKKAQQTFIICCTGFSEINSGFMNDIDAFLLKPVDFGNLRCTLNKCCTDKKIKYINEPAII